VTILNYWDFVIQARTESAGFATLAKTLKEIGSSRTKICDGKIVGILETKTGWLQFYVVILSKFCFIVDEFK